MGIEFQTLGKIEKFFPAALRALGKNFSIFPWVWNSIPTSQIRRECVILFYMFYFFSPNITAQFHYYILKTHVEFASTENQIMIDLFLKCQSMSIQLLLSEPKRDVLSNSKLNHVISYLSNFLALASRNSTNPVLKEHS